MHYHLLPYSDDDGESKDYAINDHGDKLADHPDKAHTCFMASNASNQFPNAPCLVTSATGPEVCMPTHTDPALAALAMVASFDAQALAAEENLMVAKPMIIYKASVYFAIPTSATLAISSIDGEHLSDSNLMSGILMSISGTPSYLQITDLWQIEHGMGC